MGFRWHNVTKWTFVTATIKNAFKKDETHHKNP